MLQRVRSLKRVTEKNKRNKGQHRREDKRNIAREGVL
jgi:hypothetical protein